ncbi:MAG: hypothetical protein MUC50_00400 [Myxococcota bacterium]|jgi:membrane associated rhomboid family serine protease|nr:hypothetical protein [Myxococcota bacterium]
MSRLSQSRPAQVALAVCGALLGAAALLFGLANNRWVVLSLPTPLFEASAGRPVFEARLWAVMLVSFLLGLASALGIGLYYHRRTRMLVRRAAALEEELGQARRLLASLHGKG